jgi:S-DNA-T family DNA segregation ATPase FtsK/SpoIIIE
MLQNLQNWQKNRQLVAKKLQEDRLKAEEKLEVKDVSSPIVQHSRNQYQSELTRRRSPYLSIRIAGDQAAKAENLKQRTLDETSAREVPEIVAQLTPDDELVYQTKSSQTQPKPEKDSVQYSIPEERITDSPFVIMEDRPGLPDLTLADDSEPMETVLPREKQYHYQKPPLEILTAGKPMEANQIAELDEKTEQLEQTLAVFGVKAKVIHVSCGPTITRYELQLAPGIRVNKVANLSDDIALSLAATGSTNRKLPFLKSSDLNCRFPIKKVSWLTIRFADVLSSQEFIRGRQRCCCCTG